MRLFNILLEKVVVSETSVDVIVVCACITVVCCHREVVLEERRTPDSGSTELADVVEMVDDTLDVTAVTAERLVAVSLVRHTLNRVIGNIAICKTVRHDEVDHVCSSEACTLCRTVLACCDFVWMLEGFSILREYDVVCARLCICCDLDVHEKVVRAVSLVHLLDRHAFAAFDCNAVLRDVLALHKDLERHLHACPP